MQTLFFYLSAVLSTLFRLSSYIFLRVIPTRLGKPILPTLYALHLLSSWLYTLTNSGSKSEKYPYEKPQYKNINADRKESSPLLSTILSLPSSSRRVQLTNILFNTLLMCASLDLALTPFLDPALGVVFTRVGAVYPDSVKIATRYPQYNTTEPGTARILYRESSTSVSPQVIAWKDGPVLNFREGNDWVDTVKLDGLWPNTQYEYIIATLNRTRLEYPANPISFRTFPDPRLPAGNHFRFVVSSCITPNFPYEGPHNKNRIKGFDLLAQYLFPNSDRQESETKLPFLALLTQYLFPQPARQEAETNNETGPDPTLNQTTENAAVLPVADAKIQDLPPPAQFLLFLGDFIYADVPIYIGDDREAYRRLYRRNYQSPSYRKIYEHLPVIHAYDDHEFINNFGANGDDSTPPYPNASDAYRIYNSDANYDPSSPGKHYFDFEYGDTAFFVMDTRRYRTANDDNDNVAARTMLGDEQLQALFTWLSRVNTTSTFKFIASSVPFTSLWGHDAARDSWAGYSSEKEALLEALHTVPNVIVLSGDRHEFAAIEFNSAQAALHTVWEFSTSPMNMFYIPFFRTLRMQSTTSVQRNQTIFNITDDGTQIASYTEDIPKERVLKYIPEGNHKWAAFEIDTRDVEKPALRLEVMVDGKAGYHFELLGKPSKPQSTTALGALVTSGIKDLFDKFGIKPRGWF